MSVSLARDLKPSIQIDMDDGLNQNTVFAIGEDSIGAIWMGTPGGLYRYNGYAVSRIAEVEGTVLRIESINHSVYCLTIEGVYKINCLTLEVKSFVFNDKDYFNSSFNKHGICLFGNMHNDNIFLNYNLEPSDFPKKGTVPNHVNSTLRNDSGSVIIGESGAIFINEGDSQFITTSFCSNQITFDSKWWIASHEGLYEVEYVDGKLESNNHFEHDRIECLFLDSRENLWIGSSANGVSMIHRNTLKSRYIEFEPVENTPITCWGIFKKGSNTFVATSDGIKPIDGGLDDPIVQLTRGIACNTAICADGLCLVGTSKDGILIIDGSIVKAEIVNDENVLENTIIHIIENDLGFLVCTKRSLIQLDRKGDLLRSIAYDEIGLTPYFMWIEKTSNGYIAATTTGVIELDSSFKIIKHSVHSDARVFNMCREDMCVSMDGGLYQLTLSDSLERIPFPDKQLQFITMSGWIGSTSSIYHRDNITIAYNQENGFPIAEYNQGGFYEGIQGELIVSGINGVFWFKEATVQKPSKLPYINLSYKGQPISVNGEISISSDQGYVILDIEPIIISDRNRYQIRIDSNEWVKADDQIRKEISIPYGSSEYQIELKSQTGLEESYSVSIHRPFPFWMRWWFILFMTSAFILLIIGLFSFYKYFQTKKLLKSQLAENRLNQERLRISNELHDNIGARLTHIISSLDMEMYKAKEDTKPLEKINGFARETMSQLRETIWAVSDKTVFLSEFILRLEQYVNQSNELAKPIITFRTSVTCDFELNPIQTINYFRIVQEGINNSIKYSSAKNIVVSAKEANDSIEISITDDGIGFDMNIIKMGTGIRGMNARALEANATLTVSSVPDNGTKISFAFRCI